MAFVNSFLFLCGLRKLVLACAGQLGADHAGPCCWFFDHFPNLICSPASTFPLPC